MTGASAAVRPAIRTFVAYRLVSRGYFHLSVLLVFLLHTEHSVLSVTAVLAAYGVGMAALTPFAPRLVAALGPARALLTGELCKAAGLVLLALTAATVPAAAAAQVVNAFGFALAASADGALGPRLADAATMRAVQASTQSLMFLALLVSGVAGGALYLADPRWPLYAGALAALGAAALAAVLHRQVPAAAPAAARPAASPADARPTPVELRWITYYVLTRGFMLGVFIGLLPYLIFHTIGVRVLPMTVVLAAYSLAAFLTARYAHRLLARFGPRRFAVVTAVVLLAALAVFAVSTTLALVTVAMVLLGAASGCVRPVTLAQLTSAAQEFRGSAVPARLLSRMEGLFGITNAAVILAGGVLTYYRSLTAAMFALCAAYVVIQAAAELVARRRPVTAGPALSVPPADALSP